MQGSDGTDKPDPTPPLATQAEELIASLKVARCQFFSQRQGRPC